MFDNRIYKKILDCHLMLSAIYDGVSSLVESSSQEDIDKLAEIIEKYEQVDLTMRSSILTLLKELTDEEIEEIDVVPTENGYKI